MQRFFLFIMLSAGLVACSPGRRIGKAQQTLLKDTALAGAHAGISIYDPAANHYLYNYQGEHYFVPASNTKLFTCYAAMKYLGDSLVGLRYQNGCNNVINVSSTGDPTFLHPDFTNQPVLKFLQQQKRLVFLSWINWRDNAFGKGWGWDDYNDYYMAERSPFPVEGNTVKLKARRSEYTYSENSPVALKIDWLIKPGFFSDHIRYEFRLPFPYSADLSMKDTLLRRKALLQFSVRRNRTENNFLLVQDTTISTFSAIEIPFITNEANTAIEILRKDYKIDIKAGFSVNCNTQPDIRYPLFPNIIHSQPTDSLLRPMMHRSDNFFAEQSLLMVSNEKIGFMSDEVIIDTLLKNDLKDLPQKPVWVDGSGLSRYNQFTPQDIIAVLLKIKDEFGLERIRNILPKGNTGTLTNYYEKIGPAIYAKTGSLSGQVALSGYLTCKSGKLLLFSVLINNHNSSGRAVRRAVEKFVMQVWEKN